MAKRSALRQVAGRGYWRAEDARVAVQAWRASGESLAGFARRHGLKRARLARWAVRLGTSGPGAAVESVRFHPVRVTGAGFGRLERSVIEIDLPGGGCVRVGSGFESEDLRRVVAVLTESGAC